MSKHHSSQSLQLFRLAGGSSYVENRILMFQDMAKTGRKKAAAYLNDSRMTFPCLFILMPEIEKYDLAYELNNRNFTAIHIVNQILQPNSGTEYLDILSVRDKVVNSVLKWILKTGQDVQDLGREYEKVIDISVSVLINLYQDKSVLPMVAKIIFERHRKGLNIHDTVWAFFRMRDPDALELIAKQIHSENREDSELARSLLGIEEPDMAETVSVHRREYGDYMKWLKDNRQFLYFTGESYQFSSKPEFCRVDLERKYIQKRNEFHTRRVVAPSDERETKTLEAFKQLSDEDKVLLSDYSGKLYGKNTDKWKRWMRAPVEEQIRTAKSDRGRFV